MDSSWLTTVFVALAVGGLGTLSFLGYRIFQSGKVPSTKRLKPDSTQTGGEDGIAPPADMCLPAKHTTKKRRTKHERHRQENDDVALMKSKKRIEGEMKKRQAMLQKEIEARAEENRRRHEQECAERTARKLARRKEREQKEKEKETRKQAAEAAKQAKQGRTRAAVLPLVEDQDCRVLQAGTNNNTPHDDRKRIPASTCETACDVLVKELDDVPAVDVSGQNGKNAMEANMVFGMEDAARLAEDEAKMAAEEEAKRAAEEEAKRAAEEEAKRAAEEEAKRAAEEEAKRAAEEEAKRAAEEEAKRAAEEEAKMAAEQMGKHADTNTQADGEWRKGETVYTQKDKGAQPNGYNKIVFENIELCAAGGCDESVVNSTTIGQANNDIPESAATHPNDKTVADKLGKNVPTGMWDESTQTVYVSGSVLQVQDELADQDAAEEIGEAAQCTGAMEADFGFAKKGPGLEVKEGSHEDLQEMSSENTVTLQLEVEWQGTGSVFAVGNIPQLGNWQPLGGLSMDKTEAYWRQAVSVERGQYFEFKYVFMDGDGNIQWEQTPNRHHVAEASTVLTHTFGTMCG